MILAIVVVALLLWWWCWSKRKLPVQGQRKQARVMELFNEDDRDTDVEEGGIVAAPPTTTPNETGHQNLEERRQAMTRHGDTRQVCKEEASVEESATQPSMADVPALDACTSAGRRKVAVTAQQDQLTVQLRAQAVSLRSTYSFSWALCVSNGNIRPPTDVACSTTSQKIFRAQRPLHLLKGILMPADDLLETYDMGLQANQPGALHVCAQLS